MAYETFRNSLLSRLSDKLPPNDIASVIVEVDILSDEYSFDRKSTALITIEDIPEIVKAYIASLAIGNCSYSTVKNYTRELTAFFKFTRKTFTQIDANDIRKYIYHGQYEKGWQPSTADHVRTVITGFFNWLACNMYITVNPTVGLKPIKKEKKKLPTLTPLELEKFRNACETLRERALVDFFYATGCRVSEVANMKKKSIDWIEKSVFVSQGKGHKDRITYINAECELSLRKYLASRNDDDEHLFVSGRKPCKGLSTRSIESIIRTIANRLPPSDISIKVTPHTFRRTMCTTAVKHGCPIEYVKVLAGHSSLDTTMQYVTIELDATKQAHQKYVA